MERNLASKLPTMGANTIQEEAIKPAIASLAGTAKLACMSKRPQPPDKYRSERPSTSRRSYKSQIYSQQSGEKKKVKVRTGESEHSDSEQSDDDSGHSVHIQSSKTSSMSLQSSSASSSTINSVKSAAELLEEAKEIAGVLPHGADQQMVPKKTTSAKKRRTTNETITPLQIPCKVGYLSPSIKIIKELTMRNIRYNFTSDQEPLEISCQDNTTKQSVLSLSQNKVLCQKDLVKPQLVVNTTKKKALLEPQHYQPVLRGSCKIETPGSLTDPKLSCKVENGFSQGLTSQFLKVAGVNVLDAQSGSFALVSRPQRGLQQAKTNQALSLLAKWTPKTNSGEYKTIHHLCTTHACQVLPLELQLASRVCHTQDMSKTTPVFHQQRPALRHLAAQSDTHRSKTANV
ncbi:uncharacterized protein LOC134325461 isoform X2 [Trichomycterus rosablanca]|uniref:uncharacterized protein LOC134325461 isoform X2 n=1 Tax=Trichomycterus rosablanca TaxID=2290929 RepID=UPI002F3504C8